MHTQLSQTARLRKFDKKTFFLYFFFLHLSCLCFPNFFNRVKRNFFGSYFSLMAEAVGREMQMVRINGGCREFHGVKNHAATDSGDLGRVQMCESGASGGFLQFVAKFTYFTWFSSSFSCSWAP